MEKPYKIQFSFFLILMIFVTLVSCKKNKEEITISGRVFDRGFGQYLSGASVSLSGNGVQNGIYSPEFVHLESINTDGSGSFKFTRKKDRSDSFKITVTKDGYFTATHVFSSAVFAASDEYSHEMNVDARGNIQIHLYNAYPSDNDDKIVFFFSNSDLDCQDCCTNIPHSGHGPAFDTTFTCSFYGNKKIVFFRSVTKDQQTTLYVDSLFCPAFLTETYDIAY